MKIFVINLAEIDVAENSADYEVVRSKYIKCLEKNSKNRK